MNIALKPNIRVTGVYGSYNESEDSVIRLRFSTGKTLEYPKSTLEVLYLLSGQFTVGEIKDFTSADKNSWNVVKELIDSHFECQYLPNANNKYVQAKDTLRNYTVHFPKISNVNVIIAVLLSKMRVETVFYEDGTVSQDDIDANIYFKSVDIHKSLVSLLHDELKIDTVSLETSLFNASVMSKSTDIVVNSDAYDWVNTERCITINTWNYRNTFFKDFMLFNGKVDVSDNLKMLVDEFILATRSIDDMLYSVTADLVT